MTPKLAPGQPWLLIFVIVLGVAALVTELLT